MSIASDFDMKRCVNMGNSLENAVEQGWGGGDNIGLADFKRIRAKGFDTVRIPVRWDDYAGQAPDYVIDPDFAARVQAIVDNALSHDLNVILNIHHFQEIMDAPEAHMPKLERMWEQISSQFADYPPTLWFETLNEPSNALKEDLMREAQRVSVNAIRQTNPDRIIILGGDFWSNFRELESNIQPPDDNIVYTFHYYEPFDFTHYLASWTQPNMPDQKRGWGSTQDRQDLSDAVDDVVNYREGIGRPVFLGEFGAYTSQDEPNRNRWIKAVREEMEAADIPWCLWAYANTFPVYDATKQQWNTETVKALGLE